MYSISEIKMQGLKIDLISTSYVCQCIHVQRLCDW